MMTPAISVWASSSVENMAPKLKQTRRSPEERGAKRQASRRMGHVPSLWPSFETRPSGAPQDDATFVSRRGARVLDDDLGSFPVLVRGGVVQDQDRRRPVVEEHAVGARERHRG